MNVLSSWFQHPRGGLCWRRALTLVLDVSMLGWVGCALAGLIDGAPYWLVWWAIIALGVVAAGCPHHSQLSADSKGLAPRNAASGAPQDVTEGGSCAFDQ